MPVSSWEAALLRRCKNMKLFNATRLFNKPT